MVGVFPKHLQSPGVNCNMRIAVLLVARSTVNRIMLILAVAQHRQTNNYVHMDQNQQ